MNGARTATAPKFQRRKTHRPGEILDAAQALFAERGFSATRLDDVAMEAGVSKGTLYLYFRDKEDLFRQLVLQRLVPNLEAMEDFAAGWQGPVRPLFEQILARIAELMTKTNLGAMPKIIIAEAGNFPHLAAFYRDEVILRGRKLLAGLLQKGMDAGELKSADSMMLAPIFMGPLLLLAVTQNIPVVRQRMRLDAEPFVAAMISALFDGISESGDEK